MGLVSGCATTLPSAWKVGVAAFAFIVMIVAFWLNLRLRAVARLFDSDGPQSFWELK